ncbi:MAG: DinB family protein [Fluviicola sp.]|jgi:hypothetical protein
MTYLCEPIQKRMTTQWLFTEVATITERNIQLLKGKFSSLSEAQLSWKPSKDAWSIAEIFAHLNGYAAYYHPAFFDKMAKTRFTEPKEIFNSSPLGRSAWQSMKLGKQQNVKRKFNAPKNYNPSVNSHMVDGKEVETLLLGQKELLEVLEKAIFVNVRKVKVPISISKIIRLRFGDALLFVAYHNERHMQQAINLTKMSNFPKK